MNNDEYFALKEKLPGLRAKKVASKLGTIAASIEYLIDLLDRTNDKKDRRLIYSELVSECILSKNEDLYPFFLKRQCEEFPNDPMVHCALAHALVASAPKMSKEHKDAIALGKAALSMAKQQNRLVRYSGVSLARLAIDVDDYEVLNFAISALVADASNWREEDTGYEFDFVDEIDTQRFDSTLLTRYKNLRKQ